MVFFIILFGVVVEVFIIDFGVCFENLLIVFFLILNVKGFEVCFFLVFYLFLVISLMGKKVFFDLGLFVKVVGWLFFIGV